MYELPVNVLTPVFDFLTPDFLNDNDISAISGRFQLFFHGIS